jgi:response regulator RpfG family c-di-GMP phosphodiesterase
MTSAKPRVLCVDDEPQILEGLSLHLRRNYLPLTATSGAAGLELLAQHGDTAVVISDMRMPGMDGAAFLARARTAAPDAIRMLLTGQSDIQSAISAINEGRIFRFLPKPCAPATLLVAVADASEQHRLVISERVLLEQTLHGSIKALTDVLALVNPIAFGRAARLRQLVRELAEQLGLREIWQAEVAAMLSQLGHITLPAETAQKVYYGRELNHAEAATVARLHIVTEELIGNIPRMEAVLGILRCAAGPYAATTVPASGAHGAVVERGAQLLRVALDFDAIETQGSLTSKAMLDRLRARADHHGPEVLEALAAIRGVARQAEIVTVAVRFLRVGMVLAEDIELLGGPLLVARGYQITDRFLERIRNFAPGTMKAEFKITPPESEH